MLFGAAGTGKTTRAIKEFKEVTRIKPDSAQAHWSLAVLYDKVNNGGNAVFHSKRAENLFKNTFKAKQSDQAKRYSQALMQKYRR